MGKFFDDVFEGKATVGDRIKYVDEWLVSDGSESLADFLGLSSGEVLMGEKALEQRIQLRRVLAEINGFLFFSGKGYGDVRLT